MHYHEAYLDLVAGISRISTSQRTDQKQIINVQIYSLYAFLKGQNALGFGDFEIKIQKLINPNKTVIKSFLYDQLGLVEHGED